jgi:hypothetical protein
MCDQFELVICGLVEYNEPFCYGTYSYETYYNFEKTKNLPRAIKLLKNIPQQKSYLLNRVTNPTIFENEESEEPINFLPSSFKIMNQKKQLIKSGIFTFNSIEFIKKEKFQIATLP